MTGAAVIVGFAAVYYCTGVTASQALSSLCFLMETFTTLGYGDIT
ncbi:ion channel (plasmid) [Enterobacter ludwigii]